LISWLPPYSRAERTARYLEWTALLDELLTHDVTSVAGERYSAVEAHQLPGCVQRPRAPFTVAGAGPKALRAVAQYGQAWVTYGPYGPDTDEQDWFAAVEQQSADLTVALERAGRAPGEIGRIAQFGIVTRWPFTSVAKYRETLDRLSAIGFTELSVHWPRPDGRGLSRSELDLVLAAHA
jgi:alkanesulfonate monooxygenase SsuD/methylene tetrahydromethanopterin reductase-like flavin-dependent oxidoreductase (luciferase family)